MNTLCVLILIIAAAAGKPTTRPATMPSVATTKPAVRLRADAPVNVREFVAVAQQANAYRLKAMREELKSAIDARIGTPPPHYAQSAERGRSASARPAAPPVRYFRTPEEKRAAVVRLKGTIARLEQMVQSSDPLVVTADADDVALLDENSGPLKMGKIGRLGRVRVLQIFDAHGMTAHVRWSKPETLGRPGYYVVAHEEVDGPIVYLSMDTGGFADGQIVDLPGVFEVAGNKQYPTVDGGSKTVFRLAPLELEKFVEPAPTSPAP